MAGARIDEAFTPKLPVDPRLPMTGPEEPDRKSLLPLWVSNEPPAEPEADIQHEGRAVDKGAIRHLIIKVDLALVSLRRRFVL